MSSAGEAGAQIVPCDMPARLHPASEFFLWQYTRGDLPEAVFLQYFSLPNSDYIPLARCLVDLFHALGVG